MQATLLVIALFGQVAAQNVKPQIGYVYPAGARAGSTVELRIGTYDWTPDMQLFVHDPRVRMELTGTLGEPILTPPPYWFGQKAGLVQPPLPREISARITIPADFPPGKVRFQVANANGASSFGTFVVSDQAEVIEPELPRGPIELPALPATASGRLSRVTEVDLYRFTAERDGLVSCLLEDRLGQPFAGVLEIRDAEGRLVADMADTTGTGAQVRFNAKAGARYTASIHEVDHAGDRGFVYRLSVVPGPSVVTTIPAVVSRGQTTAVQFIGYGVATGRDELETVTQQVTVPDKSPDIFTDELALPGGKVRLKLPVAEQSDSLEPESQEPAARTLALPIRLTGRLERMDASLGMPVDRYSFAAKKGETWRITLEAARFGSPVDPGFAIVDATGKELLRVDDLTGSVDAAGDFKVPADGEYQLVLSDLSGLSPSLAHTYRLAIENPEEQFDFTISALEKLDVPLGGTADLIVRTSRVGAWDEAIEIKLEGLPEGVTVPETPPDPVKPKPGVKKPPVKKGALKPQPGDIKVSLTASADAAATASVVTIVATATVEEKTIVKRFGPILVATTLKTRCKVKSTVQDGGRLVNRGTTYPADVIVERLEGYEGPVRLQMAATQQRQRRGIRGGSLVVPAGVEQVQYPVFMPEWLETSLTARINVIGVAEVADPKGNVRHVTGIMDGLIVMSLEGALLKISHEPLERDVALGGTISIPLKVSRTAKLTQSARVEVVPDEEFPGLFAAEPIELSADKSLFELPVRVGQQAAAVGARTIRIRVTSLQDGKWPAVSETAVAVQVQAK